MGGGGGHVDRRPAQGAGLDVVQRPHQAGATKAVATRGGDGLVGELEAQHAVEEARAVRGGRGRPAVRADRRGGAWDEGGGGGGGGQGGPAAAPRRRRHWKYARPPCRGDQLPVVAFCRSVHGHPPEATAVTVDDGGRLTAAPSKRGGRGSGQARQLGNASPRRPHSQSHRDARRQRPASQSHAPPGRRPPRHDNSLHASERLLPAATRLPRLQGPPLRHSVRRLANGS